MGTRLSRSLVVLLSFLVLSAEVAAESCTFNDAAAPVHAYTKAMKEFRFEDAYAVLSENMTDALPQDEWAAGQRKLFELGQVVIGVIDVRWPQQTKGDRSCANSASVPNVLSAKDRFNNQGSVEFELYSVLKIDGSWKIDAQETLIDEASIHRWFPGDTIPDFKGQLLPEDMLPGDESM